MRVLVAGGAGFVRCDLVRTLCGSGHQVRILSRKNPEILQSSNYMMELVQADLLISRLSLDGAMAGCSVVFNCAGELYENLMGSLHVDATLRIVQACKNTAKTSGQSIHFVQLSSVGTYGPSIGKSRAARIVTEETAPSPMGVYEITKTRADELIIGAEEEGVLSYLIFRPSNIYGARMPNDSIRQWGRIIKEKLFFHVEAPGAVATCVHVGDVVDALMLCGFDERARSEVFNISNDCPQEQLVNAMAKALNVTAPRLRLPEWSMRSVASIFSGVQGFPVSTSRLGSLVARTYYPAEKLEVVLGYRPQHDVSDTIAKVLVDDGNLA